MSWAYGHQSTFYGRHLRDGDGPKEPNKGWSGRWDGRRIEGLELKLPDGEWQEIAFLPNRLVEILQEGGFDAEAIVSAWQERGWLERDSEGRRTKKGRLAGANPRMIVIRRVAIDALEAG